MRGTDLYSRLEAEGRLLGEASGNNVEIALSFRLDRRIPARALDSLCPRSDDLLRALLDPDLE